MENSVSAFYDSLAADYHLIFQNWQAARERQSQTIAKWLEDFRVQKNDPVLDCACGIGTQIIGLSQLGYERLYGTDISKVATERAASEARKLGISLPLVTVDIRQLAGWAPLRFEAILAIDNVLPHFLASNDLQLALANIKKCLTEDGLFIASVRDYSEIRKNRPTATPVTKSLDKNQTVFSFQEWEWKPGTDIYKMYHYTLKQNPEEEWQIQKRSACYRAWKLSELVEIYKSAGFGKIEIADEAQSGFYQPVIFARPG